MELSEHGIVLIVEESGCLQAKVYLQREVLQFQTSLKFDSPCLWNLKCFDVLIRGSYSRNTSMELKVGRDLESA